MTFKDHFSKVATGYAAHRPSYPAVLFEWLARLPARRTRVWDCACGSGQATVHLAAHFAHVIATDASESQIAAASKASANVTWRVAPAQESGIESGTVDLVCVAQSVHWFDLPKFYSEVRRVLHSSGALAFWCYGINEVAGNTVNELVHDFYSRVVGPYWPAERKMIEAGYRTLDFPFREVEVPMFNMETEWNLEQLLGYFRTWSATTRFIAENHHDPVEALQTKLGKEWGSPEQRRLVRWPLAMRAGFLR